VFNKKPFLPFSREGAERSDGGRVALLTQHQPQTISRSLLISPAKNFSVVPGDASACMCFAPAHQDDGKEGGK